MHGGARGSGGPQGDRNGNFKHGVWTRENVETRRALRAYIREIRALLRATEPVGRLFRAMGTLHATSRRRSSAWHVRAISTHEMRSP